MDDDARSSSSSSSRPPSRSLHIVVLPWLAFGHMLPFLHLSKSLARRGHRVSFLSTPANISRLPQLPPHLAHLIRLVPLPLPQLPPHLALPPGAESTSDLPASDVPHLKTAFDALARPFAAFLAAASPRPDWVLQDFASHWAPGIAADLGVPCVFFSVFLAASLSFLGPAKEFVIRAERSVEEFTTPPKWSSFATAVAYRRYEARTFVQAVCQPNASGVRDVDRLLLTIQRCRAVALRSCAELEADWIRLLSGLYEKPVLPVGLLPPPAEEPSGVSGGREVFEWLDRRAPRSVLYVAFGSEAALGAELAHELALGLEVSGIPFLWALRRPPCDLPEGFVGRTRGSGMVAGGWVPQLEVLAHAAVGGFLTHCGLSSLVESLRLGIPLVLLPICGDQGVIARVVGEKRVGVEVERDEDDGSFTREMVAKAVRMVMVGDEGKAVRNEAAKMSRMFGDESLHDSYVDAFVRYLMCPQD